MHELTVETPTLRLAARQWGEPDAPPIVLLHGWLDNAGSYDLLAPLLAKRYRVIALELPGHGHSAHLPPGASYHYIDYVRFVLAAVDALHLPRFVLLGHSLGAGVASLLAASVPERIRQLLLIEGLGPLGDDGSRTLQRFRDALATPEVSSRPLRVFRDIDQAVQARMAVGGLAAELARPIVERGLIEVEGGYSWRSDPRLSRGSATRLAETQVMALLLGIEVPTALLLSRPAAPFLDPEAMQVRIDCVADIRVQHLDGGHHIQLEHPQAVADWTFAGTR